MTEYEIRDDEAAGAHQRPPLRVTERALLWQQRLRDYVNGTDDAHNDDAAPAPA